MLCYGPEASAKGGCPSAWLLVVCGCVESDENWGEDERAGLGMRMKAMKKKGGDGREREREAE